MATKRKVTKTEYNRWVKWLKRQGYSGPFGGLKPSHECVKRLAEELRKDPPTILETQQRDPRTIASNLARYEKKKQRGFQAQPTEVEVQPVQCSLAELQHFAEVKRLLRGMDEYLAYWYMDFWEDLVRGKEVPFIRDFEKTPYFPGLKGHLVEPLVPPQFWKWWDELKEAAIPFENAAEALYREMLKEARKRTGLTLIPWSAEEKKPQEGVLSYFLTAILDEQRGVPAYEGASYSSGSLSYLEDSLVWGSVEEGLARLRGEQPTRMTMTVSGSGLRVISENAQVIEKLPTLVKRPLEVGFFLRFGRRNLAFVQSPDELPKVQQAHESMRKAYGSKLKELDTKGCHIRDIVSRFRSQLGKVEVGEVFPGYCPRCPPSPTS